MRKVLFIIICLFSIVSLASCGKKTTTKEKKETITILESDLENQICDVASFLDGATFCVLNYSSSESENASSLGSGVIYKREINANNTYTYYLVTNRHVIIDGEKFKVYTSDGSTLTANRLGYSETYDIGVLTFTSYEKYNVVPFANIDDVKQGELCFAMGTPLYQSYVNTFTRGNVSGIRDERIQHTADINAGNSGGPLVNLNGQLIGINVSKLSTNSQGQADIDGMCFAIRVDIVSKAIDEIEGNNDAVVNPVLGMTVVDVNTVTVFNYDTFDDFWNALKEEYKEYYKGRYPDSIIDQKFEDTYGSQKNDYEARYIDLHAYNSLISDEVNSGMLVKLVVENSVCDVAGVKAGDVIVGINDVTVESQSDFSKEFFKNGIGDTIKVLINRQGETLTLNIAL